MKELNVGIIGYGKIGKRSAELYHAFGCQVLAYSRSKHPDCPDYVEETDFDDLLRRSDVVVLHCPLTDATRGLIDAQALSKMKNSAILLNLARGPVVVENDLVRALEDGVIAGAGIDVFDVEPPLNVEQPILRAKNVIVTPHVAFATKESMLLRAEIVFNNLAAWLAGKPTNVV